VLQSVTRMGHTGALIILVCCPVGRTIAKFEILGVTKKLKYNVDDPCSMRRKYRAAYNILVGKSKREINVKGRIILK